MSWIVVKSLYAGIFLTRKLYTDVLALNLVPSNEHKFVSRDRIVGSSWYASPYVQ